MGAQIITITPKIVVLSGIGQLERGIDMSVIAQSNVGSRSHSCGRVLIQTDRQANKTLEELSLTDLDRIFGT